MPASRRPGIAHPERPSFAPPTSWSLATHIAVFTLAGGVIAVVGTRLAAVGDHLADRTGLGEALVGAVLLGATTSLPGITTSVTAAAAGHPRMAVANAVGGIAAQTAFLAVADIMYRKVNLEHAAASVPNMESGSLLMILLAGLMAAEGLPAVTVFGVHPATPLLVLAYLGGIRLVGESRRAPKWLPLQTPETREDVPDTDPAEGPSLTRLWGTFAILAVGVAISGWLVARSGVAIAERTGLEETVVGGLFTAVVTSTPELWTSIGAVRQGALTLAVGNIIGGNSFDVMFAAAADVAWREGSIYHALGAQERSLVAMALVMTAVLILGLVHREKRGVANIGFESAIMLLIYVAGMAVLTTGSG